MMLLLSNCRLSIVRLTPPLPDRLRKYNVDMNMKLIINALISTPSLCDSQCENNLARGSKHYIPPSLPPSLPALPLLTVLVEISGPETETEPRLRVSVRDRLSPSL